MTNDNADLIARTYAEGYDAGLNAERSVASPDLQVLSLANALDALALHCANKYPHRKCVECETTMLLARVVAIGNRMIDCQ